MLQINNSDKRIGWDGKEHTWEEIENMFRDEFEHDIITALRSKNATKRRDAVGLFWNWCLENTSEWLTAKPAELRNITEIVDDQWAALLKANKGALKNEVLKVYGYKHSRLKNLANWLNVKTCPYCNMHYTLFLDGHTKKEKMAKFQFDHFYSQSKYPMLSMSLYNLIPSCVSCNQGKSDSVKLSLDFHPYYSAIKDKLYFRVVKPLPLWEGSDSDVPEIELIPQDGCDLEDYEKAFHVKALYQHHKDVAREVFAHAYAVPYYDKKDNFPFVQDAELKRRLQQGMYTDEDEIDRRPLTKFRQDLYNQALANFLNMGE